LPGGQAASFVISTGGFAVLARVLGPEPYAKYAVILFVFTATSLFVDLSPQGFAIVTGFRSRVPALAAQIAAISASVGTVVLAGVILGANALFPGKEITLVETVLLELAFVGQMLAQVPRSFLVLAKRYRPMALVDVCSTAIGLMVAIGVAFAFHSALALTIQLAATALVRAILTSLVLPRDFSRAFVGDSSALSLRKSIAYGVRVIPLNLASYLSRSLDSGILPGILPAAAAAGYARTYQIVVVPITQLQLSLGPAVLERLSRGFELEGKHDHALSTRLWRMLHVVAVVSGVAVAMLSPLLQAVLFGPGWPMVNVMITAMGCLLPALATATYCSWALQVQSTLSKTFSHLAVMLITPILAILGAVMGGTQLALIGLVVGAGVQSIGLAILHFRILPDRLAPTLTRLLVEWTIMAAVFVISATLSGFWAYRF
jgi:O-antigen/teichoic acid export membrane protein